MPSTNSADMQTFGYDERIYDAVLHRNDIVQSILTECLKQIDKPNSDCGFLAVNSHAMIIKFGNGVALMFGPHIEDVKSEDNWLETHNKLWVEVWHNLDRLVPRLAKELLGRKVPTQSVRIKVEQLPSVLLWCKRFVNGCSSLLPEVDNEEL